MIPRDRRQNLRIDHKFRVTLHHITYSRDFYGMTSNLSQGGALIATEGWESFQPRDETVLTFWLPPEFSGQNKTIGLRGPAATVRIDQENHGIGVHFMNNFRQFQRVDSPDTTWESRYKTLAYYLSTYTDTSSVERSDIHPAGFLIERSKMVFDRDIIFQINTLVTDDEHMLAGTEGQKTQESVLAARVIEIKPRKRPTDSIMVTIGRSSENDIALYNKLISRKHAELHRASSGTTCHLVDSGSTNGTFLNTARIPADERQQLTDGDEISFGPETKVIYLSAEGFLKLLTKISASNQRIPAQMG